MSHRRRALLLGGLALVLGGLAALDVAGREAALARRVGAPVEVVVARRPIAAGALVRERALAIRRVPGRFAPATAVRSVDAVIGLRAAVDIAAGTDLSAAMVRDGARADPRANPPVRRGERVVEVVALGSPALVVAGSRVDVLVTPEPRPDEDGEAILALEDVEVLAAAPAAPADGDEPASRVASRGGGQVAASLRVTLRQAIYLAAAQDFGRALRLLPRAAGDRDRGRAGLRAVARPP